jgi:hypothetical protein
MGFFATRFLKQLEQNDKAPKQITSPASESTY